MRFRFSLRDLFWLTLVVGISLGWYVDQVKPWQTKGERFLQRGDVSYAFGKAYAPRLAGAPIRRGPQWNPDGGDPPASAHGALQAASKLADRLIGDQPGFRRVLDALNIKSMEGGW